MQGIASVPVQCASEGSIFAAVNPRMDSPQSAAAPESSFGLVVIDNSPTNWHPAKINSTPPSLTAGMGTEVSSMFAMAFNQSRFAEMKGRWAVVTTSGVVLMLAGIKGTNRPSDPAAWPSCVRTGFQFGEVEDIRDEENEHRKEVALVPRQWTVALRPTNMPCGREGGAV